MFKGCLCKCNRRFFALCYPFSTSLFTLKQKSISSHNTLNNLLIMMMMNCFCGLVDWRKAFTLISSQDHYQRSSPSWISNMPQAGFEPVQNLSSCFVEWSCAVMITTTPWRHYYEEYICTKLRKRSMNVKQLCFVCLYHQYPLSLADCSKLPRNCWSSKNIATGYCNFQSDENGSWRQQL